jgi:hypothetical protein
MKQRELVLFNEDGTETVIPSKWEICGHCSGEGTSSAYLGAFTSDDWSQMDDEWKDDYIAGHFDRACEHCEGGKVKVPDFSRMSKAVKKEWLAQERGRHEDDSISRMERLMEGGWERGY